MTDREASPAPALPPPLDAALGRLAGAVARLKAAGERHGFSDLEGIGDNDAVSSPGEDRARLALDAALARVERLTQAQAEALDRLGRAEASVQAVLRELTAEDEVEEPPIEEAS